MDNKTLMSDTDFAHIPVPISHRRPAFSILFIWLGFILIVATMSIGGYLGSALPAPDVWSVIFSGNLVLAVLAGATGYVGALTGKSFSQLLGDVAWGSSWKLAILYIPFILIGWYAYNTAIFGNLVFEKFGDGSALRYLYIVFFGLLFASSAFIGFRFIGKLSYLLVPLILFVSVFGFFKIDSSSLVFGFAEGRISWGTGFSVVVSSWIFTVLLVMPDLTRFAKSPAAGALAAGGGIFLGNTIALGLGALAAGMTQRTDPSAILDSLGYTPLVLTLALAGIWSSNDNNMYSSSLGIARALDVRRRVVVIGLAICGAIVACLIVAELDFILNWLLLVQVSAPALGGIVLGSFVLRNYFGFERSSPIALWIGWIAGSAISTQMAPGISIVTGFVSGFLLWLVCTSVFAMAQSQERIE